MMHILRKNISDLSQTDRRAMIELMRPYYLDPVPVVNRGLDRNDEVLLLVDQSQLIGFQLVGWRSILVGEQSVQLVCIGLIGTSIRYRGYGLSGCLIRSLITLCRDWELANRAKLVAWFLVANPVSFYSLTSLWGKARFGIGAETDPGLIHQLKHAHNFSPYNDPDNPFILRNQSVGTRYSLEQIDYQRTFAESKGITVFDQLQINEKQGDRLLVLCEVPEQSLVEKYRWEIKERLSRFVVSNAADTLVH